jgi:hypothetical protein
MYKYPFAGSNTSPTGFEAGRICIEWNVVLASLEELDVAAEVAQVDVEALAEVEKLVTAEEDVDEVEVWVVVLDVAGFEVIVASEETEEVGVGVVVVDAEVAVLWVPASKKAEPRMAMIKIARTAVAASLLIAAQGSRGGGEY